ncbi:hypothetical protein LIER_16548 [Lithospermum erythrorhizon]|uniref:Gnk2-homologous domain-containing protein n=1 Tax=Lithospermum erythrorhizon TaxID=34254 RepID=A0AAV3QCF7_LITER
MSLIKIFLILILLCMTIAESTNPAPNTGYLCITDGKKHPQLSSNINITLSKLVAETSKDGFSISSYGSGTNKVFGLAQCRGDIRKKDCSICTKAAATEIIKLCSSGNDARIWYDICFLRYNIKKFFGKVDTYYGFPYSNEKNVTNPELEAFNDGLGNLLNEIGYDL